MHVYQQTLTMKSFYLIFLVFLVPETKKIYRKCLLNEFPIGGRINGAWQLVNNQ